ncbi:MAG: small redox-active disulfide protein 2 [Clostridia bacterium]|nr:small redox-active disulfide protein 2 [Clostridia bacterium]
MEIKILGGCCKNCDSMLDYTKEAVKELSLTANIEKIDDPIEVAKYGVMRTPGIVIDGKVMAYGKMLNKAQIIKIIEKII